MTTTLLLCVIWASGQPPASRPRLADLPPIGRSLTVQPGRWRVVLKSPGGELPFELEVGRNPQGPKAWIINGDERLAASDIFQLGNKVVIDLAFFDATLRGEIDAAGTRLVGAYTRRRGPKEWVVMDFQALAGEQPRFAEAPSSAPVQQTAPSQIAGRWAIKFDSDPDGSVGLFEARAGGMVVGTILTTTGDYRYLSGVFDRGRLRLSCFDGAHAFLFDALHMKDGSLAGDFWSGAKFHDRWVARRDDAAALPDGFAAVSFRSDVRLADVSFPDTTGKVVSLADPAFAGKARIIEVFGTWCPNCADAGDMLNDLNATYRARGLSIVGIAFELTGDTPRDLRQIERFVERHGTRYPILLGGTSDKKKAAASLPWLADLKAYPTFLFFDARGTLQGVCTGFAGPATGDEHHKLREAFEKRIEQLLSEAPDASR